MEKFDIINNWVINHISQIWLGGAVMALLIILGIWIYMGIKEYEFSRWIKSGRL